MASTEGPQVGFPALHINTADIGGSYRMFETKFAIYLKMQQVSERMSASLKKLTLLSAIGDQGLELLMAKGTGTLGQVS